MKKKPTRRDETVKNMRRVAREQELAAGGRLRAVTFPDKRAAGRKAACRGRPRAE